MAFRPARARLRLALSAICAAGLLTGCATLQSVYEGVTGANHEIPREEILSYLDDLSARGDLIAGTQVNEYEVSIACDSADRLVEMTGKELALLGLELMFAATYDGYSDQLVAHARAQARRGGLVTLAWHQRNPLRVCPRGEFYDCSKTPMSDAELARMLTPGTRENALWKADVAASAETLKRLQAAHIPVLFRPYHEMTGDWFWWGQKDAFPELWDALYEELTDVHGLNNLIWVWSGDRAAANASAYWPHRHPPDVVGTDVYESTNDAPNYTAALPELRRLAPGAPFAFTEVGKLPAPDVLDTARPAWVLAWGGEFLNADWTQTWDCSSCNTEAEVKAFFAQPRVKALDDMPMDLRRRIAGRTPQAAPPRPHCPSSLLEPDT